MFEEIISRERDLALEKQRGSLITDRRADEMNLTSLWMNSGDFRLQKDSLGNVTSVRVYLSKSELILRLQKDI